MVGVLLVLLFDRNIPIRGNAYGKKSENADDRT